MTTEELKALSGSLLDANEPEYKFAAEVLRDYTAIQDEGEEVQFSELAELVRTRAFEPFEAMCERRGRDFIVSEATRQLKAAMQPACFLPWAGRWPTQPAPFPALKLTSKK